MLPYDGFLPTWQCIKITTTAEEEEESNQNIHNNVNIVHSIQIIYDIFIFILFFGGISKFDAVNEKKFL
jgi:hypothetical protein